MNILVCYATTEGQTRKIARFCANQLFSQGHSVELLHVADADELDIAGYDAAILAGSVHIGHLQKGLAQFATAHAGSLNAMPTLLVQVSLAAAGSDEKEHADLDRIADEFCKDAGWVPGQVVQVAGAFRFTQYDFFRSWAMRFIAAQKGETVDPQSDREYTDWGALGDLMHKWPSPS